MGFLGKLFGKKAEEQVVPNLDVPQASTSAGIPPEKVGLDGNFDESGLAKRVAKALDDANISDEVGLWVAQTGSTVVLKYNPDAAGVLEQAKSVAMSVPGATAVNAQPNS